MATVRTCDRCGESSPVEMNKPGTIRAYAFDAYNPSYPPGPTPGITTVADLCEGCAGQIRKAMVEPFLGDAHQAELEKAHATPVDAGVAKDRRLSGVKILPSERNKNDWPQGDYVNQCCECKETFLGQKRSCACRACVEKKGQEHFTQPPVDAGGEDATIGGLVAAAEVKASRLGGWKHMDACQYATAHLAAIRAGKVPNIVDATVLSDERGLLAGQYAEISALRARLADAERRADEMEGKAGEWIAVDVHKERVRAAIADCKAMNERLLGERDAAWKENARILARVAESERERQAEFRVAQEWKDRATELVHAISDGEQCVSTVTEAVQMAKETRAERDRALARVVELEESAGHADECCADRNRFLNERDRALADLAAMTSARDALAGRLADKESDHAHDRFQLDTWRRDAGNLKADLAAERERREKAEAHLAVSLATVAPYNDVCMERDAARAEVAALKQEIAQGECEAEKHLGNRAKGLLMCDAVQEVAALKARKVTLPECDGVFPSDAAGGGDKPWYYKESIVSAIRSAGVEVES